MGAIVYLAALMAIVVIGHWTLKNDRRVQEGKKTIGILAMKEFDDDDNDEDKKI